MDRYTKLVLTVIAFCLVVITGKTVVVPDVKASQSDISYCMDRATIEGTVDKRGNISAVIRTYC